MSNSVNVVTLAAFFALVTMLLMQVLKPLIEKIPGINTPSNQVAHDSLLRLIQFMLNFGFLVLASITVHSVFAGLQWYDLLAMAFGQGILSHASFKVATFGS